MRGTTSSAADMIASVVMSAAVTVGVVEGGRAAVAQALPATIRSRVRITRDCNATRQPDPRR